MSGKDMLKIVQWCQLCAFLLQLDNRRRCFLIRIQWATVCSFLNSLEADNSDLCYCQFQSRKNRFTSKIFLNFNHNCIFIKRNQMRPLLFEKWEVTRNIRSFCRMIALGKFVFFNVVLGLSDVSTDLATFFNLSREDHPLWAALTAAWMATPFCVNAITFLLRWSRA